jgi:hypothetical protein
MGDFARSWFVLLDLLAKDGYVGILISPFTWVAS